MAVASRCRRRPSARSAANWGSVRPDSGNFAQGYRSVHLSYNTRFESFMPSGDGVIATVKDLASGRTERIAARYLVDCSGGHSGIAQDFSA